MTMTTPPRRLQPAASPLRLAGAAPAAAPSPSDAFAARLSFVGMRLAQAPGAVGPRYLTVKYGGREVTATVEPRTQPHTYDVALFMPYQGPHRFVLSGAKATEYEVCAADLS
jgi:hypothetical protein